MYLSQALRRENNNLDVIRLVAACAVIYGHANALVPEQRVGGDFVASWLKFDYSGSLAVKVFFFLSGLVVTNSLLDKRSLLQFVVSRGFRIWPALLAVLLVMAFVVGPLLTTLPADEYLRSRGTWHYVYDSAKMLIQFELPGVFTDLRSHAVNGSLWSIPYEVQAYCLLIAAFALGVHRMRWIAVLVFLWICVDPLLPQRTLFAWRLPDAGVDSLAPCFAAGAMFALFKERIEVSLVPALGFFILFIGFRQAVFAHYLLYGALFWAMIYLCTRKWVVARQLPADISYGVYLWGWPVQQLLVHWWPDLHVQAHRVLAMLGACILGALSWYVLEKPAIALGKSVYAWLARFKARVAVE